jgi:hypothetical protein
MYTDDQLRHFDKVKPKRVFFYDGSSTTVMAIHNVDAMRQAREGRADTRILLVEDLPK